MVRNLSLDELALILCDMYEMDEWLPNPVFDKKEFTIEPAMALSFYFAKFTIPIMEKQLAHWQSATLPWR